MPHMKAGLYVSDTQAHLPVRACHRAAFKAQCACVCGYDVVMQAITDQFLAWTANFWAG